MPVTSELTFVRVEIDTPRRIRIRGHVGTLGGHRLVIVKVKRGIIICNVSQYKSGKDYEVASLEL